MLCTGKFRSLEKSIAELCGMDAHGAYRFAFSCVRQLGLVLRNAYIAQTHGVSEAQVRMRCIAQESLVQCIKFHFFA